MANKAIKGVMGVLVFVIVDAVIILLLQTIMAAFNFTGDFATILSLIFGSLISVLLAILAIQKIADEF